MSHISYKYPGQPWQIKVFADGSTNQSEGIVLTGDNDLSANTTYRGTLEVRRSSLISWQWSQNAGSGSAADILFFITNETKTEIDGYDDVSVWSPVPITFGTLPNGVNGSELLPMSAVVGTYMQVVISVGGAALVGFRLTGLVK